jgi:uncharacterized membrane protein
MDHGWTAWLERWTGAGLIDTPTAERIRAFEAVHAGSTRLRWPILIALAFGALMIGGGILLFVAANWDALSPAQRFALVIALVSSFHVAGALTAERFGTMSETLHAIGTAVLGAGIALAGQIFNLDEHWPGGIMLWALGAGIAWLLLRQTAQLAIVAILAPAWVVCEWIAALSPMQFDGVSGFIPAAGVFLLALTYMTAITSRSTTATRRTLLWIGAVTLVLSLFVLAAFSYDRNSFHRSGLSRRFLMLGWTVALGGPLVLATYLRRRDAWANAVAAVWVVVLFDLQNRFGDIAVYAWWALGAIGLVAWAVRDGRAERINLGAAIFAATILAFYFSQVMDKLGRSASLIGLGLLFLGGGWALERVRRRLVQQARETS